MRRLLNLPEISWNVLWCSTLLSIIEQLKMSGASKCFKSVVGGNIFVPKEKKRFKIKKLLSHWYWSTPTSTPWKYVEHILQQILINSLSFLSYLWLQSMDHRPHSASHSLQATPNSTIHSLGPPTHPRLADLWGAAQVEAHHVGTRLLNPNGQITDFAD